MRERDEGERERVVGEMRDERDGGGGERERVVGEMRGSREREIESGGRDEG